MDLNFSATHCAGQSIGPANQLFALLIQTIISAQCAISPPELWPQDYAAHALEHGMTEPTGYTLRSSAD